MLYSGEQFDPNLQMQYLRARYYDQNNGRFNRLDPFAGNRYDPQSLHKYAYAHSDPAMGIDPSGNFFTIAGALGSISIVMILASSIGNVNAASKLTGGNNKSKIELFKHNLKHGYASPDKAAIAALKYLYGGAGTHQKEFGGRIYYDKTSKRYHFTAPTASRGRQTTAGRIPKGTLDAGIYHSHPSCYSGSEVFSGSELGQYGDIDAVTKEGALSRIYMLDTKTGVMRVFKGGIDSKYDASGSIIGTLNAPISTGRLPYVWGQVDIVGRVTRRFYSSISEAGKIQYREGELNIKLYDMIEYKKHSVYDQKTGKIKPQYR